ncbi:hypothetical protein KSS87_001594 [Heliosperma pusillum]|nr:hypothetical protein KSS87_001594 [Heliosperma pusillum]
MFEVIKYLIGWAGPSGFGSKSTAEDVTLHCLHHLPSITAIITGATSGIGEETARVLAKRGARVILPARRYKAAEKTKARILAECPKAELIVMELDLSSLSSVRNFVREFQSLHLPLNLLINNAGMFSLEHQISEDGIEMTFATNYLGHFLLTKLLMKKMVETAKQTGIEGRIINVSSHYHNSFTGDIILYLDLITKDKSQYDPSRAYALSKLANILHTKELAHKLNGAATTCYVATNTRLEKVSGKYFEDCNQAFPSKLGSDSYEAQRLWAASEIMASRNASSSDTELEYKPLSFSHTMYKF